MTEQIKKLKAALDRHPGAWGYRVIGVGDSKAQISIPGGVDLKINIKSSTKRLLAMKYIQKNPKEIVEELLDDVDWGDYPEYERTLCWVHDAEDLRDLYNRVDAADWDEPEEGLPTFGGEALPAATGADEYYGALSWDTKSVLILDPWRGFRIAQREDLLWVGEINENGEQIWKVSWCLSREEWEKMHQAALGDYYDDEETSCSFTLMEEKDETYLYKIIIDELEWQYTVREKPPLKPFSQPSNYSVNINISAKQAIGIMHQMRALRVPSIKVETP